jgi:uncharacterized damage-inducible protein DinB
MKSDEIKLLFDYARWADQRILRACAEVSHEQYAASAGLGVGHGSLRATLLHIVDSLWQWRLTFTGFYGTLLSEEEYRATELKEIDYPTLKELEEGWRTEQQAMQAYIGGLGDEQLNGMLRYTDESGVVRERVQWHCLFEAVNHGTHHRGEAAALLASYGHSPGDIDFTLFLNEGSA